MFNLLKNETSKSLIKKLNYCEKTSINGTLLKNESIQGIDFVENYLRLGELFLFHFYSVSRSQKIIFIQKFKKWQKIYSWDQIFSFKIFPFQKNVCLILKNTFMPI